MSDRRRAEDGRIVLGFFHATMDAAAMRAAAEMARLLSRGLYGLFVEDESLLAMASLPFAREIRLTTHTWHTLSTDTVETEMREAARQAQHLFDSTARATGIAGAFEIVRGDPVARMAAACRAGDILVIAEQGSPGLPASRNTWPLPRSVGAGCSILLLPARPGRAHGGIVAMLADERDRALDTACSAAAVTGEDLVLLLPPGTAPASALAAVARARAAGLLHQRITARIVHGDDAREWLAAMPAPPERLIVLARSLPLAAGATRLASTRGSPVLLLGEVAPEDSAPA